MVVQAEAGLVLATEPARAAGTFETISETGREALAQLDRALGVLRADGPSSRSPQPGLDGLPDLVERARLAGLDAELSEDGDRRPVPADLAAAVYRVVQEAVTNTVRHAHARRLRARLDWRDTALAVTVADDGRGPVACGADSGRGLVGMRERVDAFGGELTTGPDAGGVGFLVAAVFPLDGGRHG
jgi:signal transduction histidine kinase